MLSPHSSNGSQWKQLYQSAMVELDLTKLPERIADARRAIQDRAQEVLTESATEERHALNSALSTLRLLETATAREKSAA